MFDFYDYQRQSSNTMDQGGKPFVSDIHQLTVNNNNHRVALWTGKYLQLTVMNINPGDDIGLEMHNDVDQFISIEQGMGVAMMGDNRNSLDYRQPVFEGSGIFIPAGTWHNLVNMANEPLKLYSIYAPINHPFGTIEESK